MTFVIGSYQAVEHPGGGHRASAAGLWRGEDLRSLNEVAMTVLPADCADSARSAVESVAAIRHPHLLPVIEISQDDGRVAVICPWPAGGRLAELVIRRSRLTAGEALTVLIPLAAALAVAHGMGIRHGEVCPETLWFDVNGRPLLGALAVSRLIAELNDGLPAGCRDVAPEVVRGDTIPGGETTTAADVFSLGSVALFCLTGRSAWPADEPADVLIQSAAGLWPDLPDDAGPPGLVALVREMLHVEPGQRPSAASLVARLAQVGEPAPILFVAGPAPAPASADRWRGWSTAMTRAESVPARVDGLHAESTGMGGAIPLAGEADQPPARPPATDATTGPERGSTRVARRWKRPVRGPSNTTEPRPSRSQPLLARAGIALLSGLLIVVLTVQVGVWWAGWEQSDTPFATNPGVAAELAGDPSWTDVVIGLDAARGRAMDAADPALLAQVYLDSASAAGTADAAVVQRLADNGLRVVDGVHQIVSVTVDSDPVDGDPVDGDPVDAATDDAATTSGVDPGDGSIRLAVVDTLPAHPIVDAAGRQVGLTPARAEERRVLVLRMTDHGYRISGVEPG